jgi:hypothetical protein
MNDIEILEHLEKMQKTFIEDGLQGYEMVIVNTKNLIENLIQRKKDLEQIEKEHKEENGRLRDRIKELEGIIAFKSKKRKNGTMRYKKTNKLNKYGVNGVCQDMRALKRTGEIKYRAYITLFGKQHTLGTHSTLEGAIQARKEGEKMIENILKNKYKNY